ncbi:MAG: glycosyltransferase family 9 protein [Planctomycetota bacterium]
MSARRVLVVRLSAVGDCVHAVPAVRALRAALPEAHIAWAIDDRAAPLLEGLGEVNEFLVMPRRSLRRRSRWARWRALAAYRRRLRAGGFDAAVDFQGLAKSALVGYFSGAAKRIGPPRGNGARELSWLFYNCTPEIPAEARHVAEKSRALLAPLGVDLAADLPSPQLPAHPAAAASVESALAEIGLAAGSYAVLNPGAGWPTKLWPPEHFSALAGLIRSELGLEVVVSWFGAEERRTAEEISAGGAARPAPETDLPELAELLRRAALFVGSDTGPTHVAAAAGAPTVALFGPADAERNHPLGARVETLTAGLECSPCWRRSGCPRDRECMRKITPEAALDAARRLGAGQ